MPACTLASILWTAVLTAALAPMASPQFGGLNWSSSGICTAVSAGSIHLEVCGASCGGPKSSATAILAQSGWYTLDFQFYSNDDCCSRLRVLVAGHVLFEQGDGFGAFCSPGSGGPLTPCSQVEQIGFEGQAGDPIELVLENTACFSYVTTADFTSLALGPAQPPSVASVDPSYAFLVSTKVHGANFTGQSMVLLGGVPATVTAWKSNELTLAATGLHAPGFLDAVVTTPFGSGTLAGGAELRPSLAATASGIGGALRVEHDTGTTGLYVLALGTQSLGAPQALGPGFYHGLLLDLASPFAILKSTVLGSSAPGAFYFPIPGDPALSGALLRLQALASTPAWYTGADFSFTNMTVAVVP